MVFAVSKGDLHGLPLLVVGVDGFLLGEGELLEDIQRHQCHDALTVRRDLADGIAPVIHRDGLHPLGLILRKVLGTEEAAVLLAVSNDLLSQSAPVEALGLGTGDLLQGVGMVGQADHITGCGTAALRSEGIEPGGILLTLEHSGELIIGTLPHPGQVGGSRIAFPGIADSRSHALGHGQSAEAVGHSSPGSRSAGNHGGGPAIGGHGFVTLGLQGVNGDVPGGEAAGIEAVELLLLFHPDEGKGIGTNAVGGGLTDGQGSGSGNGSVHGVAALLHGFQTGSRSLGAGGTDHAIAGIDGIAYRGIGQVVGNELHSGLLS